MDGSTDWVYAFVQLNEALSHAPLSSMGHISNMTDGTPSEDAHSQLHQLQVCKLLQYMDPVVCPEGPQWSDGSLIVHLQRASYLGCCCPHPTHLQTAADGSGPWNQAA